MSAKREETRARRLAELIERSATESRLGVLSRPDEKTKTKTTKR